ncbi:MAG: hypothetical protein J6W52_07460 [Bacteroidaceae bacterium]|nr:hypothetical protein [Bacteroidaceae bacterium]
MLTVTLAATVGVNTSNQFAKNSRFEKASTLTTSVADKDEENENQNQNENQNFFGEDNC